MPDPLVCSATGPSPRPLGFDVCLWREISFDCFFPVGIKGGKRSNIYCLNCHGLQDKHGPSIVLIITGDGGREEKAKELSKTSSCPDVHNIFRSTNVTST